MATQDFQSRDGTRRYVNGGRVRLNGSPARQWGFYTLRDNCWVYQTTRFFSLRATRAQIQDGFY